MKAFRLSISLLLLGLLMLPSCKKKEDGDNSLGLLALLTLTQEEPEYPVADIDPVLGFPGTVNTLSGEFPGIAGDYTVTINSVSATGIQLPDANSLKFTMPSLGGGFTENTTVPIVIKKNGVTVLDKTIRYRPTPALTLNQPNGYVRAINLYDSSSFFSITLADGHPTPRQLFNLFGYSKTNLDIFYLVNATSTPVAIAQNGMTNTEFKKTALSNGTYIIQVKWVSGPRAFYRINAANGEITPNSTWNGIDSEFKACYDKMGTGDSANVGTACRTVNTSGSRPDLGRCTFPTESGIQTRHYYGPDWADVYYMGDSCYLGANSPNPGDAIYRSNSGTWDSGTSYDP